MTGGGASAGPPVLVDAHVHLYDCFPLAAFLDGAAANFAAAAARRGLEGPPAGVLRLAEGAGEGALERLDRAVGGEVPSGWRLRALPEAGSLAAERADGARLVLVLACRAEIPDGEPLAATLAAARAAGALPVVPWGAGKWWRGRGRLVAAAVEREDPADFFLGDSGGRPRLARRPALFERAARRGIRVLPGSDPLPFARHARRAGSTGFALEGGPEGGLDGERPGASLRRALRESRGAPAPYGDGERALPFLVNAVAMQLRKRRGRSGGRAG